MALSSTWPPASLVGEGRPDAHIAETRRRRAMARAHGLHGLTFSAIRRAPQSPLIEFADGVAGIPEFGGDAAVAGILQHADFFPTFDFPTDFGGKLKLVAAVIDGPGAIRLHQDCVVAGGDEAIVVPGAGEQADVGHSNDGEAVPALGAHGAGGAIEPDQMGRIAVRKIAAKFAIFDDVGALGGNAFVIVSKSAQSLAGIEAGGGGTN